MSNQEISTNILIIMPNLNTGGAERVATSYANWVVANTNSTITILLYSKPNSIYSIDERVNIVYPKGMSSHKIKKFIQRKKFIDAIIREKNIHIVFTLFPRCAFLATLRKNKKNALIFSERANPLFTSTLTRKLSEYVASKSTGIIFQTERVKHLYPKKLHIKSTVIANPVSNPKVFEVPKTIHKTNTITAVGRLCYQKGFDTLIAAFAKFHKEFPDYQLVIYGEGEDLENLTIQIKNMNLQKKVLLPGVKADAITEIAKSKIFVLSSRYEGMPNALLEAMSVGTACISTDCEAGPREIIRNYENGILIPVDDTEAMYQKMKELASDEDLRHHIEKNSKDILNTNSVDTIFSKYHQFMQDVYFHKIKKDRR